MSEVIILPVVDSTNNYAANLLGVSKPDEGTVIMAYEQTAGRGQRGTQWESEAGSNLLCSYIFYPHFIEAAQAFYLSKCVALALAGAVESFCDEPVHIKWPNDIMVKSQKMAGILIEISWLDGRAQSAVAGIGWNLNQRKFNAPHATSLALINKEAFKPEDCLEVLSRHMNYWYGLLREGSSNIIDESYRNRLFRLGKLTRFNYKGESIRAMITGVDASGRLMLYTENGEGMACEIKELAMEL